MISRFRALVDALLKSFSGRLVLLGPVRNDNGAESDNGQGWNIGDLRAGMVALATSYGPRVVALNAGPGYDDVLLSGDLPDGTHPSSSGHLKLYNWLALKLPQALAYVPSPPHRYPRTTAKRRTKYLGRR